MKLYVTFTSSYARLARILVIEKMLEDRVKIIAAKTRTADSPYYRINPSGRVPYLIDDSGVAHESPHFHGTRKSLSLGVLAVPGWRISGQGDQCERRRSDLISFINS